MCHVGRLGWCKARGRRRRAEVWVPRRRPQDQDGLSLGRGLSPSLGNEPFGRWDLKCISFSQVRLPGFFLFFSALRWMCCFVRRTAFFLPATRNNVGLMLSRRKFISATPRNNASKSKDVFLFNIYEYNVVVLQIQGHPEGLYL